QEQKKEKRLQEKEQKQDDKSKLKTRSSSQGKEFEDIDKRIPIHIPQPQRAVNYVVKEEEEEEGRAVVVVEQGSEIRKEILDTDDQLDKNQSGDVNKAINEEIDGSDEKDEDQEENKPSEDS
ncbi:MAG: hypothetical protein EZS28_029413, partial [Streblomastix strix]